MKNCSLTPFGMFIFNFELGIKNLLERVHTFKYTRNSDTSFNKCVKKLLKAFYKIP